MKKRKRKSFVLRNATWCADILVIIGGEVESAEALASKKLDVKSWRKYDSLRGRCFLPDDDKSCAVWFDSKLGAGTLSHEAFHLTLHILQHSGCYPIQIENEEAASYLLDWIVREIGRRVW